MTPDSYSLTQQAEAMWTNIEEKYGMTKVIGAVNGTLIKNVAPSIEPLSYICRKGFHAMQLQVVCDKLRFIHAYAG
ncbi:putative nuclease HARBI1 isoform X2 [Cephus cinctus]|nr:putative nuclease HARBI1 isoform X2 [Cephus cinctus]